MCHTNYRIIKTNTAMAIRQQPGIIDEIAVSYQLSTPASSSVIPQYFTPLCCVMYQEPFDKKIL